VRADPESATFAFRQQWRGDGDGGMTLPCTAACRTDAGSPVASGGKVGAHQSDRASSRRREGSITKSPGQGANHGPGEIVEPLVPHH
jgi:hypothetical protein